MTAPTLMKNILCTITLGVLIAPTLALAAPQQPVSLLRSTTAPSSLPSLPKSQTPIGDTGAVSLKNLMENAKLRLTNFNARIQDSNAYSTDLKKAIDDEVQKELSWISEKEATVTSATTAAEVRALLQQVRDHYEQLRFGTKRIAGEKLVAALGGRAAALASLHDTLAASAGTSNESAAQLAAAATAIAAAKDAIAKAQSSFLRIVSNATVLPNWSEGIAEVKGAQQQLKAARKALARVLAAVETGPTLPG